ncbi:uncharacterized protein LOC113522153 [Galleria mellonella]|uniref:Uncharacterized protein LOC113522153 n=1 Tax=Galleria mellonella TaxID=7137 RepID=A0ABM3MA15_GALME|nr:uncharacterized protein LOC113522153 [Galleria mellonella]XP_052748283.1 uncharacterized protein LOC113522153 [Galleria mellonella]XP_052748284.1 uncharacterized protein LOC113522153 [Galleria mellonella]XP_052748285.1 uncharacterized protein LOC113522153 [Galleria mellonella]
MAVRTIHILLTFIVTTTVHAQFYDLFAEFRPQYYYQNSRTTINPFQEERTTKRPKPTYNHRNDDSGTNTQEKRRQNAKPSVSTDSEGNSERNRQSAKDKAKRRIITSAPVFNFNFLTTPKPTRRTTKATTRNSHSTNAREGNRNRESGVSNGEGGRRTAWRENDANFVVDDTASPNFGTTKNYYTQNQYTTYNPLYNVPGVRPAVVDSNRPPITNKPATQRPLAVFPRPTDSSVIRFPQGPDTSPPLLTGPDEDSMSSVEKRRYIEISERMCDKYKSRSVTKLQAIPLLPSPDPVQFNVTQCAPPVPLVVGGKVVSIREFPHMALLGWTKLENGGYAWKCGGSLLSDKFVLTAAHCAYQEKDNTVVPGAPRVVQLGSSYLDDTGALVVKVAAVYRHSKYTQTRSYFDTALAKLAKTVTFSEVIQPACLGVPPSVGEHVVATGWGRTEYGGDQSLELRSVSIPVWDMADCRRILGVTRKLPEGPSSDSQVCAGDKNGGKDTCQGDSGGPAQLRDGCVWRVVAVTSVGRSCGAANTPALYAKVDRAFIAAVVFGDQANTHNSDRQNNYDRNQQNNDNTRYNNNNNYDRNNENNNYDRNNQNNNDNKRQNNYDSGQSNYNGHRQQNNYDANNGNDNYGNNNGQSNKRRQDNNYDRNNEYNSNANTNFGNNYNSGGERNQNNNFRVVDFSRPTTKNYRYDNYRNDNSGENSRSSSYRPDYNVNRQKDKYRISGHSPSDEDIIYWPDA